MVIIKRIDDLGRIVIPKEIRRAIQIREGDPFEITINKNGNIEIIKHVEEE